MSDGRSGADERYCRRVLPRVSRTFALNIRLLSGRMGHAVRVGYLLCRASDTLEDSWPGTPEEIRARFDLMMAAVGGDGAAADDLAAHARAVAGGREDLELVGELPRLLRVLGTLPEPARAAVTDCLATLGGGMCRYASRAAGRPAGAPYLDTDDELHDYCFVVAGCVGEMLTRLLELELPPREAARAARRRAMAPVVGEALQLTNILLDWPSDVRRGRCHVPASWLEETGLSPADLTDGTRPGVRALARRLEGLARAALARVPDYLDLVPTHQVRYRLFCLWPTLWALGSLRHARRDPEFPWGVRRPRLPRGDLWRSALAALVSGHGARSVRGLFRAHAAPA